MSNQPFNPGFTAKVKQASTAEPTARLRKDGKFVAGPRDTVRWSLCGQIFTARQLEEHVEHCLQCEMLALKASR